MTRLAIEIGDRLACGGDELRFDGRRDAELDFASAKTGARMILTDAELAEGIASDAFRLVRRGAVANGARDVAARSGRSLIAAPDFLAMPEEKKAAARRRLAYLKGLEQRDVANLSLPALQAALADIAIELGDPQPPHHITIWRWRRRAGERLSASLLLDRDEAKGNRTSRLSPEVQEIIGATIDARYLKRERIPMTELLEHVEAEVDLVNETRIVKLRHPSYGAIRSAVRALSPRDLTEARHGKAVAAKRFDPVRHQKGPEAPLDLVEIDHTKADLFVIDSATNLPIGRPWITLAMDRCTRMPFGIYIGFDPPSVHSVMQCLRNGMLPKPYVGRLVAETGWKVKHAWPVCGRPRELSVDRGMEFVGGDLADFGAAVGIDIRFSPRKKPWYKGAIERYLGTLNRHFLQRQHGSTFSNVLDRGDYDAVKNAVVSFDMLQVIVHRWLLDIYACGKHAGLGDVPMRVWDELTRRFPVAPIADIAELDMLFGRVQQRRLGRTGLLLEGIQYISDELVTWLTDPEFVRLSPKADVKLRYDPADLSEIRVLDPRTGRYQPVPAGERDRDYARGLSIWQHKQISRHRRERMNGAQDRAGRARARKEVAELVEAAWADRKGSSKTRQRLARHMGTGRVAMAGDSTSTGPARSSYPGAPSLGASSITERQAEEIDVGQPPVAARVADESRRNTYTPGGTLLRRLAQEVPHTGRNADDAEDDVYAELGIRGTKEPNDGR